MYSAKNITVVCVLVSALQKQVLQCKHDIVIVASESLATGKLLVSYSCSVAVVAIGIVSLGLYL